jgi:hypothetical protein
LPQGYAVIVGLTGVDPASYGGLTMTSGCSGAEADVDRIDRLVALLGFLPLTLKTGRATAGTVQDHLRWAARTTRFGDLFLFYFAGHGQRCPDRSGDEGDGFDELLLAYDRPLTDDELDESWREFPEGVRILVVSDACHSGTNYKFPAAPSRIVLPPMKASLVHLAACRDEESAEAFRGGGAFTIALCRALSAAFTGDYRDLLRAVAASVPSQTPRIELYGPGAEAFVRQRPFSIEAELPRPARRPKIF